MFAVGVSKAVTDLVHLVWINNNPNIIPGFQILLYLVEPGQWMAPFTKQLSTEEYSRICRQKMTFSLSSTWLFPCLQAESLPFSSLLSLAQTFSQDVFIHQWLTGCGLEDGVNKKHLQRTFHHWVAARHLIQTVQLLSLGAVPRTLQTTGPNSPQI